MGKLLPIILMIIGGAVGGGAGIVLKPEPEMACDAKDEAKEECSEKEMAEEEEEPESSAEPEFDYIAMNNQFVVPVIQDELVRSLVVLSLSLETTPENTEAIFSKEPKLRDAFLSVLFDHSHIGGFNGAFTESGRMEVLRTALREAAQSVVGKSVSDVLITDIARQEM